MKTIENASVQPISAHQYFQKLAFESIK